MKNPDRMQSRFDAYLSTLPLQPKKSPVVTRPAKGLGIVVLLGVLGCSVFLLKEPTSPVPQPENGALTWHQAHGGTTAPFRFEAATSDQETAYYVRLLQNDTRVPMVSLFVHAGESASVQVPLGAYRLVVAEGSTWYGETRLFGRGTRVTEGLKALEFAYDPATRRSMGRTVSYDKRLDGNYPTVPARTSTFD